jgi:hypothetical protein
MFVGTTVETVNLQFSVYFTPIDFPLGKVAPFAQGVDVDTNYKRIVLKIEAVLEGRIPRYILLLYYLLSVDRKAKLSFLYQSCVQHFNFDNKKRRIFDEGSTVVLVVIYNILCLSAIVNK